MGKVLYHNVYKLKDFRDYMETDALESLGLTRNESVVYITLLELGKAHIAQISEKTRMHRRTIYDCLERLEDRGLVSFVMEGKTRMFIPINPQKLKEIAEEKEEKIESILPKLLEALNKSKIKTEVSVHKGKEGLRNVMDDLIKSKSTKWYSLTSAGKGSEALPFYIPEFHKKRIKAKIELNIIFNKNKLSLERSKELRNLNLTKVRFIDTTYLVPISIWLYINKIAFMLWESETAILIENKETADSFKNYFKLIWNQSKP